MKPIFIAEIKMQSPFGFVSPYPFMEVVETAIRYGDWIAVHTNPLWGGSYEQIEFVRRLTDKPILAKGIHSRDENIQKALEYGADNVLVVERIPSYGWLKKCLIEMSYQNALPLLDRNTPSDQNSYRWVSNSRNLKTGAVPYNEDLGEFLNHKNKNWVCQASGIYFPYQVNERADAFIVGEQLIPFCKNL